MFVTALVRMKHCGFTHKYFENYKKANRILNYANRYSMASVRVNSEKPELINVRRDWVRCT